MASSSSSLLLLISLLAVLPFLSSARPCKTLFFAYTISSENIQIATTSSSSGDVDPTPTRFFAVYRVISPFPFRRSDAGAHPDFPHPYRHRHHHNRPSVEEEEGFLGMSASSLQERARDILVVVAGLLFGVGCGAITAATIYLAWSLLTNQYHACGSHDDNEGDEEEDEYVEYASDPNKLGYVKVVDEAATKTASPATKEGYEG